MNYYAHTAEDEHGRRVSDQTRWQLLKDHLQNVARLARRFAEPLGLGAEAELAGLLHDLGKYRTEFQEYLRNQRKAGSDTHHAIYGGALAWERALAQHDSLPQAFAIAGHHAGLPNANDLESTLQSGRYPAKPQAPRLASVLEGDLHALVAQSEISGLQSQIQGLPAAVFKPACEECSLFEVCLPRATAGDGRPARLARQLFEI